LSNGSKKLSDNSSEILFSTIGKLPMTYEMDSIRIRVALLIKSIELAQNSKTTT